ncbi:MAG: hypothetical protein IAI50_21990 [Candidatus Eremiobacteraeota bacterium]|nr:hypothetical protein [Candidatus Eremiobacteraeota bacterium]
MLTFFSRASFFALVAAIASAGTAPADTLTYQSNTYRTGWNSHETKLTTANVATSLQVKFTAPVDGLIFGQPLVALNEKMPTGPARGLAIVGTNNDSLYAFDAVRGTTVWKTSFAVNGATPVPVSFTECTNVGNEDGILSTPVIDRSNDTVYVVAATLEGPSGNQHIHHRLHALSLATGVDKMTAADIGGTYVGPHGTTRFDGDYQFQRPGLLEANGQIYIAFGGQCDFNANLYHGWVFAYSTSSLQRSAAIDITPNKDSDGNFFGGIWMSGGGVAADNSGNIYLVVGNGTFNGTTSFGESAIRLPPNLALSGGSFFTPYTYSKDNQADADFGSGGIMLLPDASQGVHPDLAVAQGKDGIFTVMDRTSLGGYVAGGPDNVVAELSLGGVWSSPGAFQDAAKNNYVLTTGGPLYSVKVSGSGASVVGQTSVSFPADNGKGSTPAISSNGTKAGTAIAWIVQRPQNINTQNIELYAFDATDLSTQLFSAALGKWPMNNVNPTLVPTIAAGRVYVPTANSLVAFGLNTASDASSGPNATSAVATIQPMLGSHVMYAIIARIGQNSLQIRRRDGRAIAVDITRARAKGHTGVLYVNRPVALYGAYDRSNVYHVEAIGPANGIRYGGPWPADR